MIRVVLKQIRQLLGESIDARAHSKACFAERSVYRRAPYAAFKIKSRNARRDRYCVACGAVGCIRVAAPLSLAIT